MDKLSWVVGKKRRGKNMSQSTTQKVESGYREEELSLQGSCCGAIAHPRGSLDQPMVCVSRNSR